MSYHRELTFTDTSSPTKARAALFTLLLKLNLVPAKHRDLLTFFHRPPVQT